MKKIILIGAGGHCKVIIDIIKSKNEYKIAGITDQRLNGHIFNIPIIGNDDVLKKIYNEGVEYAFICIGALGNIKIRNKVYQKLKNIGFKFPVLIHKYAVVSPFSEINEGSCVMAGAIINSAAVIGENCIINSGSIIEHDCIIGNNTHISPGATIAGNVNIGDDTHIGIGSTIIQGINIGSNVTVGAGAVVISDIESNSLSVGVPAKVIKIKN